MEEQLEKIDTYSKKDPKTATLRVLLLSHSSSKEHQKWYGKKCSILCQIQGELKDWLITLLEVDEISPIYVDLFPRFRHLDL